MSNIKNIALAPSGRQKIEWVTKNMPILAQIEGEFAKTRPLDGVRIALSIHLEAKTARLAYALRAAGAEVSVTGCNVLSTQDDVAAALAADGFSVNGFHGASDEEYMQHLINTLEIKPHIIIDDGGDLLDIVSGARPDLGEFLWGGCEETTTGIARIRARERAGELKFPMIAVNDADCKHLFDNRYGTGQSTWDGINRTTNLIVAGKTVVVAGYGWCGKGIAMRAKGFGANVVVTEIDAVKALEAHMDGFAVAPMAVAAAVGDVFVTATGCENVIRREHFKIMKNGAVLCNAGHFDVEVSKADLESLSVDITSARNNITGYKMPDGRELYLLAEGRLVNLAAGDGHPAEIMDMSFAIQALSVVFLAQNHEGMKPKLYNVPREIDDYVARLKLAATGLSIDTLTAEQERYLSGE